MSELEFSRLIQKIQSHPEMKIICGSEDPSSIDPIQLIMRWVNYSLENSGQRLRMTNFHSDLTDSIILASLMSVIFPEQDFIGVIADFELIDRAQTFHNTMKRTGFNGVIPTPEEIVGGEELILIIFLSKVFLYRPKALNSTQQSSSQIPSYIPIQTSTKTETSSKTYNKPSSYESTTSSILSSSTPMSSRLSSLLKSTTSSTPEQQIEIQSWKYFPKISAILGDEYDIPYKEIKEVIKSSKLAISDHKFINKEEEEDHEQILVELVQENRDLIQSIKEAQEQILSLEQKLETEEQGKSKSKFEESTIPLSLAWFGDESQIIAENIFSIDHKLPILSNSIQNAFNTKSNSTQLDSLLTKIQTLRESRILHDGSSDSLLSNLNKILENYGKNKLPSEISSKIERQLKSLPPKDIVGIFEVMKNMFIILKEAAIVYDTKSDLYSSIRLLFELYAMSRSLKSRIVYHLLREVFVPEGIIEGGENLSFIETEIFQVLDISYQIEINIEKFKKGIDSLIELNKINFDTTALFENSYKEALGETMRLTLINILSDEQNGLVQQTINDYEDPTTDSIVFEDLLEKGRQFVGSILLEKDIQFITAATDANNCRDSLNSVAFVVYNFTECLGISLPFIRMAIAQEVLRTSSAGSLFRANDIATKMITKYSQFHGKEYLKTTLEPVVERITHSSLCFEVDRNKYFGDELEGVNFEENMQNLKKYFHEFVDSVFNSIIKVPLGFRVIASTLKNEIIRRFPDNVTSAVGGFIFLRFFCPAIVNPSQFGIPCVPTKDSRRGMLLISTAIQALSNGITFSQNRMHMQPINDDIVSRFGDRRQFLQELSVTEGIDLPSLNIQPEYNSGIVLPPQIKSFIIFDLNNFEKLVYDLILILQNFGPDSSNIQFFSEKGLIKTKRGIEKLKMANKRLITIISLFKILDFNNLEKIIIEEITNIEDTPVEEEEIDSSSRLINAYKRLTSIEETKSSKVSFAELDMSQKVRNKYYSKHYIVLKQNLLAVYKKRPKKNDIEPKIVLELTRNMKVSKGTNQYKKRNVFVLSERDSNTHFSFSCQNAKEAEEWVYSLRKLRSNDWVH